MNLNDIPIPEDLRYVQKNSKKTLLVDITTG